MILDMDGYSIDFDRWLVTAPNVSDMPITLLEVNGIAATKEPEFVGVVDVETIWNTDGVKIALKGKRLQLLNVELSF